VTFGSLFAGIGGMDLGLERAGMECRWQVEIDPYASRVLEKHWPNVKRYTDVRTVEAFDYEGWRLFNRVEPVDLICGGFPCQDISLASATGVGIIGERSGLWKDFNRIVAEVRPTFVLAENVPALRNRGLAMVLQDLWSLGYDAEWHCIPACAFGAHHERDRIWIVAYPAGMFGKAIIWGKPDGIVQGVSDFGWTGTNAHSDGIGCDRWAGELGEAGRIESQDGDSDADPSSNGRGSRRTWGSDSGTSREQSGASPAAVADTDGEGLEEWRSFGRDADSEQPTAFGGDPSDRPDADTHSEPLVRAAIARGERHPWTVEPGVVRMVHGVSNRVDRLGRLGNTVVPQVAEWIGRRIVEATEATC
jgi:DNA (cytosine-5)-methyltransferase 1